MNPQNLTATDSAGISPALSHGRAALSAAQLDALYSVGHMLYEQDRFVRAADVFRYLCFIDPRRTDAWWALGACHEQLDEHEVASVVYGIGFSEDEERVELGLLCARARARSGDPLQARALLDELRPRITTPRDREVLRGIEATLKAGRP